MLLYYIIVYYIILCYVINMLYVYIILHMEYM